MMLAMDPAVADRTKIVTDILRQFDGMTQDEQDLLVFVALLSSHEEFSKILQLCKFFITHVFDHADEHVTAEFRALWEHARSLVQLCDGGTQHSS